MLEAYGWYEKYGVNMGVIYADDNFATMMFYGQLETVPKEWEGQLQMYRCGYYEMDIEGTGFCTNYENRPNMCSGFPYGPEAWNEETRGGQESIVGGYDKCSWNVRWLDFEVVQGLPMWGRSSPAKYTAFGDAKAMRLQI